MLSLQLKSGEYLTIGEDVVVQVFKSSGQDIRVSIKAPREISILRGEVRERNGEKRPEGLYSKSPKKSPSDQVRTAKRLQRMAEKQKDYWKAITQLHGMLDSLEEDDTRLQEKTQAMRKQLACIAGFHQNEIGMDANG